jgi:hypothetical protein
MEPKPLTRIEQKKYAEFLGDGTDDRAFLNQQWAQRLLAAETYWREAVRDSEPMDHPVNSDPVCIFCGAEEEDGDYKSPKSHNVDCPWLLAQED